MGGHHFSVLAASASMPLRKGRRLRPWHCFSRPRIAIKSQSHRCTARSGQAFFGSDWRESRGEEAQTATVLPGYIGPRLSEARTGSPYITCASLKGSTSESLWHESSTSQPRKASRHSCAAVSRAGRCLVFDRAITTHTWPATNLAWLFALYAVLVLIPLTSQLLADHLRSRAGWAILGLMTVAFFYFGWHHGGSVASFLGQAHLPNPANASRSRSYSWCFGCS